VLRDTRPGRLVVVATYRESELGRGHPLARALADLRRDRLVERVALGGLDDGAAAALIAGWVADAAAGLVDSVLEETGGNPFFIEEVLRHLLESGRRDVPESVREVIGRRLDRLGDDAVHVLETAAVIGPEFELGLLKAAWGEPREVVLDALENAADANLIRTDRVAAWTFTHALIREALHAGLSGLRRTRLHARVAEALAARPAASPAELAHHGLEAAPLVGTERAAEWARAAGDTALGRLAYEEAAEHYRDALQALEPEIRPSLLLALADALVRAGDPEAAGACEAAVTAARGDSELFGRVVLTACGIGVTILGLDEPRITLLEEALAGTVSASLRARLLSRLAIALYYAPGRRRRGELSAQAVAVARDAGDPDALLAALNARHVALWHPDGLDERFRVAAEMIQLAASNDRPEAELQARNWRCVDLWEAGDRAGFRAEAAAHERLADELRLPAFQWYAPIWRAAVAAREGRREDALRLADEAAALAARAGDPNGVLFHHMVRLQLAVAARDFNDELLAFTEHAVEHYAAGTAYAAGCAWVYAERGRDDDARAMIDRVVADDLEALPWTPTG
jgi:hypothetical protein